MNPTATFRTAIGALALLLALGLTPSDAHAQIMRSDAIWAPTTSGTITLDGALDEGAWGAAPAITLRYGERTGDPGSGYKFEGGLETPNDPTEATIRFVVADGILYMGAVVSDNSVGGSSEFNRKDGFLMSILGGNTNAGGPAFNEYFYSYWYPNLSNGEPIPDVPGFIGTYGNFDDPQTRTEEQIERWDAVTVVDGTANDDSGDPDTGYTVEMKFDLTDLGYDLTTATQVGFSISVYDVDGFFPFVDGQFAANRVWWQNAFNGAVQNYGRIYVDPAVTDGTGDLPGMMPDFVIKSGAGSDVTVDGALDEAVWGLIDGFEMAYVTVDGDDNPDADALAVRDGYPGIGPISSGQFQPTLDLTGNGEADPLASILDPVTATVKWFHKDGMLYVGVDVQDQAVTGGEASEDRWDGFRLGVNHRTQIESNDNFLQPYALALRIDENGDLAAAENLLELLSDDAEAATFAVSLGDDTILNDASTSDDGYQIEMSIKLSALGYDDPAGQPLFVGANVFDWDAFDDPLSNYGSRVWAFRERANASAAYALLSAQLVTNVETSEGPADGFVMLGAYPNPTTASATVRYVLPEAGTATVDVYDVLGRHVASADGGAQAAGPNGVTVATDLAPGVYLYRVTLDGPSGQRVSGARSFTVVR